MSNEQKQKLKDYRKEYYKKYYAEKKLNNKKQHIEIINDCIGAFYFNVKVWLLIGWLLLGWLILGWLLLRWLLLRWLLLGWLLLIFSLNKTPLGETGCLRNPYFLLTDCLGIQFFDLFPFPNTVS